jgi:Uma2 family endonuclease
MLADNGHARDNSGEGRQKVAQTTAARRAETVLAHAAPPRRRFTADEFHRMSERGILRPDERLELLDGEIVQMAAIGSRHMGCVNWLMEWLVVRLVGRATVSIQNPVRLSSGSELQPDLAILRLREDGYAAALPTPEDVLLLVEVADTSYRYDRVSKLPRYAAAGIPEVWIVDLQRKSVLACRDPNGARYERTETLKREMTLIPEAFPDLVLPVAQLFR